MYLCPNIFFMAWKKSLPYFLFQSLKFAKSTTHFRQIWSYRRRWFASFGAGHNSMNDAQAWLTFSAIDHLNQFLNKTHRVFEYGGGGSTLFFLDRAGEVVTVEDQADWMQALGAKIREQGHQHWTGRHIGPETLGTPRPLDPANPDDFASSIPVYHNITFEAYAKSINAYPAGYFDVVLVDGRARPSCIAQSIPLLKRGALLVIDNAERPHYTRAFAGVFAQEFDTLVDAFLPCPYSPDFIRTIVLRKK
jgi:hypothetical protein